MSIDWDEGLEEVKIGNKYKNNLIGKTLTIRWEGDFKITTDYL